MNPFSNLRPLSSLPFVAFRQSRALTILAAILTTQAQAILDTNANLLSDLWEKQHNSGNLFAPTILATNDEDKDGWTNAQEAEAGTDPFNPNPPDGIVTVTITPSLTAGAFTLTWPTLVGKNYQLKVSTDLVTWSNLGAPITSTQNTHSIGINTIQPDTTIPPKVFWQVVVGDLDTDGDGLTDAEEYKLNTDPESPNSIAGIPDLWLATYFSSILQTSGISGINLYADTDGDGYTNLEEHLNGTDPKVSDAPTEQQWIIVKGDGPQGEPRTRTKQITIPKGQTRLVVVAIASEEYPEFTEPDDTEQYDDLLTWNIAPSGQTPIAGEVHVNDRHVDWQLAEIDGQTLAEIPGPVHYEVVKTITATEESDLIIDVEITATNIADDLLPSYVAIGLLPVEVIIPKLDSSGAQIDGEFVNANELKVAKWEDAFEGTGYNGSVKDDFIAWDKDRFYVRVTGGQSIGTDAVKVATEDCPDATYNDDPTKIELTAIENDSISNSMILVSDNEDDDFAGSGAGVDDQDNDRTHKVQLEGNLVIKSIYIKSTEHDLQMKIPVPAKKQVSINFYRFDFAGAATEASIRDSIKWTKERYAQVALKINDTFDTIAWPDIDGTNGAGKMSIYGDFEVDPSLQQVYYDFIDNVPHSGICLYNVIYAYASAGIAVSMKQIAREEEIDLKYLNKAFVHSIPHPVTGVAIASPSTTAHELLHVLAPKHGGEDHNEAYPNILVTGGQNTHGDHRGRKRINSVQQTRIYEHINVTDL